MIRSCLGQIITFGLIAALVLWFFRAPESVAGLIVGFFGLVTGAADGLGRFATAMSPLFNNLL